MRPAPYFERLAEAYAVLDGIPDHQITLDIERVDIAPEMLSIGVNEGRYTEPGDWDELVLTPDIWLSLCPPYIDIVWPLIENWPSHGVEVFWRIEGHLTCRFEVAMAHLFNLFPEVAEDLFGMRGDDETDDRSDKEVILDRIAAFLRDNGQGLTVGSGHVDPDEMLEHGIVSSDSTTAEPADADDADEADSATASQEEEKAEGTSGIQTEVVIPAIKE